MTVPNNLPNGPTSLEPVMAEPTGDEFVVLTPTSEEMEYVNRQEALNLKVPESVTVVGCGGVGSWIAMFLALAGVKTLWLFDGDTVNNHNLNRLPLPPTSVGENKAVALEKFLTTLRPNLKVFTFKNFNKELANACNIPFQWVVCTTDTLTSRQMVYECMTDYPYIEAAAEGEDGSIAGKPAEFSTSLETHVGYASVPVWVGPCVSAAYLACAHILHLEDIPDVENMCYRMGWNGEIVEVFNAAKKKTFQDDAGISFYTIAEEEEVENGDGPEGV